MKAQHEGALPPLPAVQETWVQSLGWEDPLEKGMATNSSILAWRIPWTEEPGGLQSIGRGEAKDSALLSSRDAGLLEPPERPQGSPASSSVWRDLCDPMNYSPPGSSVRGILQARILELVAILFSRGSSQPRD